MTKHRDPDVITRAWLDLMPSEAPDRAIAAVLQVTETTPQVRRLPRPASWRFPRMNRLSLMTAGVVVVAVGVTSFALATAEPDRRVGQPPPSSSDMPTPSATPETAGVSDALRAGWFGGAHPDVADIGDVDTAHLAFTDLTFSLGARIDDQVVGQLHGAARTVADRLEVETLVASPLCNVGDTGLYRWSLARDGSELTLEVESDDCAARSSTLSGSWYRETCTRTSGFCIGDLAPGEYQSWNFTTGLDDGRWRPRIGALTYSVPEGWTNSNDFAAGYWLEPTDWHHDLIAPEGRDPGRRIDGRGIYVFSRPGALMPSRECDIQLDPAVGTSAEELIVWLTQHPALDTSAPRRMQIGELSGFYVDARLAADWTARCADEPAGVVLFQALDGAPTRGQYDWGTITGMRERYILVDVAAGRTILINISAPDAEFDALATEAMEIVETFEFE